MNEQEPHHDNQPFTKPQSARDFIGKLLRRFNINAEVNENQKHSDTDED